MYKNSLIIKTFLQKVVVQNTTSYNDTKYQIKGFIMRNKKQNKQDTCSNEHRVCPMPLSP